MAGLRSQLESGRIAIGAVLDTHDAMLAELLADPLDWIYVDLEHSTVDHGEVPDIVRAAELTEAATFVRVPESGYDKVNLLLDAGADGIIFPQVETAEDARNAVQATKYPPLGGRGVGYGRALDFGRNTVSTVQQSNEKVMTAVIIENQRAVENVEEIMSITGVDVAFVGPLDLFASKGMFDDLDPDAGVFDLELIEDDVRRIAAAASDADVSFGLPASDEASLKRALDLGAGLLVCGSVTGFVRERVTYSVDELARALSDERLVDE